MPSQLLEPCPPYALRTRDLCRHLFLRQLSCCSRHSCRAVPCVLRRIDLKRQVAACFALPLEVFIVQRVQHGRQSIVAMMIIPHPHESSEHVDCLGVIETDDRVRLLGLVQSS